MPRVVSKTVYKYDELSDTAKMRARAWWLEGGLDYDWWDAVVEDAKEVLSMCGFSIKSIEWDQYMNVTLVGDWRSGVVKPDELKKYAPEDKDLHDLVDDAARIRNDTMLAGLEDDEDPPWCTISRTYTETFDCDDNVNRLVVEVVKDACQWVKHQLQREEEYLTSDEVVEETIIINEYEFNEDGTRC